MVLLRLSMVDLCRQRIEHLPPPLLVAHGRVHRSPSGQPGLRAPRLYSLCLRFAFKDGSLS